MRELRQFAALVALGAFAICLSGCGTVMQNDTFTSSVGGVGLRAAAAPNPEVDVGQAQADLHMVPTTNAKTGELLTFQGPCNTTHGVDTYAILQGNASADAHGQNAGPTAATAINRGAFTGEAALHESLGDEAAKVGGNYDVETKRNTCPTAPGGASTVAVKTS